MLPLHHSPINIKYLSRFSCSSGDGSSRSGASVRPSTRSVPALASARGCGFLQVGCGGAAAICAAVRSGSQGGAAMSVYFEELDFRPTPMGVLSLRRRRQLGSGLDVYEIKLGDEFLMSSQFTVAEIALARLGLAALDATRSRCRRWRPRAWLHRAGRAGKSGREIIDRGRRAGRSHRMARAGSAAARQAADRRSALPLRPRRLLRDVGFRRRLRSARAAAAASMRCWWISTTRRETCCIRATPRCTSRRGSRRLAEHLHPGGVFALWSNDPPDDAFESCPGRRVCNFGGACRDLRQSAAAIATPATPSMSASRPICPSWRQSPGPSQQPL